MGTTIAQFDARSSRIVVKLGLGVDWTELRDHLFEGGPAHYSCTLDCIRAFDQGSVSDETILINWRTVTEFPGCNVRVVDVFKIKATEERQS